MKKNEQLTDLLISSVEAMGYELVGVEYYPSSVNSLLRVYIDKENGVNLDDCMAVNGQINGVLDVEDPIASRYTLEVSSPGLDRPLFSPKDFKRFTGHQVKIRVSRPIDRQRNFKGKIVSVNGEIITIQDTENKQTELDFNFIDVARLIPKF